MNPEITGPSPLKKTTSPQKKWIQGLKTLVQLALTGVLIWYLSRQWMENSKALGSYELTINWSFLALAFLCALFNTLLVNYAWKRLCRLAGSSLSYSEAFISWNISLLGKYIPGKVWLLIFRVGIAAKFNGHKGRLLLAYILECLLLFFVGAFLGTVCIMATGNRADLLKPSVAIFILLLSVAVLNPTVLANLMNRALKRMGEPEALWTLTWKDLGIQLALYAGVVARSEERRVGKECRSRWSPYH